MLPPADRIYDPGQGAKKDLTDTGDDFLAIGPALRIMQLYVKGLSAAKREVIFQVDLGYPVPERLHSELRMMEVAVTTGAIRHAEFQSDCCHQQTNAQFFTSRISSCCPPNSVKSQSTEGKSGQLALMPLKEQNE